MAHDPALPELIADLRHDLAKYLCLPIRMLPRAAELAAVRSALEQALLYTRQSPQQTRSAREIYTGLRAELARAGAASERLLAIDALLERAFGWQAALDGARALDQASIERDFAAVATAVDAWLDEVRLD